MSTRSSYAPGTPCWIDTAVPDVPAAVAFYSGLFGWEAEDMGEAFGHYHQFSKGGERVAGLGPVMEEGQPAAWMTYVATDDIEATVRAVREAGGSVVAEPMEIPQAGHMAVFADDEGAFFAGWQGTEHPGCGRVNEPGALAWSEVNRRDAAGAKAFYAAVFGWDAEDGDTADGTPPYTTWKLGGAPIGGMLHMDKQWEGIPAHWATYFAVADTDAAVARVEELGGATITPPFDTPPGRIAIVADPAGATFVLIALNPEMMDED